MLRTIGQKMRFRANDGNQAKMPSIECLVDRFDRCIVVLDVAWVTMVQLLGLASRPNPFTRPAPRRDLPRHSLPGSSSYDQGIL